MHFYSNQKQKTMQKETQRDYKNRKTKVRTKRAIKSKGLGGKVLQRKHIGVGVQSGKGRRLKQSKWYFVENIIPVSEYAAQRALDTAPYLCVLQCKDALYLRGNINSV